MKTPRLWPGIIFVLLGLNVCIVTITVLAANADRSFGVEPDYYAKAAAWNRTAAQRRANQRLGWTATLPPPVSRGVPLTVRVADRAGAPVAGARVSVESFHHARSRDRLRGDLSETAPGEYRSTDLAPGVAGVWEFRVRAERDGEVFTADVTQVVVPAEGEP